MARKIFTRGAPTDPRLAYWDDNLTGSGTLADPLSVNVAASYFTQYAVQFVHPTGGNNSWEGTIERPKRTRSAAYNALISGGTMYVASGCKWSDGTEGLGLTNGQGMRLSGYSLQPSGWLTDKAISMIAWGGTDAGQLGGIYAMLPGGTADGTVNTPATDPGIWIATSLNTHVFQGIGVECNAPARIGWDYIRNADMTIAWGNITSASRASGFTTFTFTLPAGHTITAMSRTSNVVTVTLASTPQSPCIFDTMQVYVNHGSGAFGTGVKTILTTVGGFQYTEAGPDVPTTAVSGTLKPVGAIFRNSYLYDIIEVESTDGEFPTTQYPVVASAVTGATTATITVRDPWGYAPRSATVTRANIGRLVPQMRFGNNVSFDVWNECLLKNLGSNVGSEAFMMRPSMDHGSGSAGDWTWIRSGSQLGINNTVNGSVALNTLDPDRCAAHLAHGGSTGGISFIQNETRLLGGNIRVAGSQQGSIFLTARNMIQNGSIGSPALRACVELLGGSVTGVVDHCSNHDDPGPGYGLSVADNMVPAQLVVIATKSTGGLNSVTDGSSYGVHLASRARWDTETESLDYRRQTGNWRNDGMWAGKREDLQSSFGVIQHFGKDSQISEDPNAWPVDGTMSAATIVGSQSTLGLDNTNTAYRISGATGSGRFLVPITPSPPLATGDHILVGAWVRGNGVAAGLPNETLLAINDGTSYVTSNWSPFAGPGVWQWLTGWCRYDAANVASGQVLVVFFFSSSPYVVYMPRAYHLPISVYSREEVMRLHRTFRPVPNYLASGSAGTAAGVKLIGHAGLGVDNSVFAAPSGANAVLQGWEPRLRETGAVKGYEPYFDRAGTLIDVSSIGGAVATTRTLTAGAGLTGGGDLSANRTFDVVAGDATIVVNANDIVAGVMQTANYANTSVTLAKVQDITSDRLLGRDTAGSGVTEQLTVGGGIEFTGSGGIQTSAFTGDATKAAGGTVTTLANAGPGAGTYGGSGDIIESVTLDAKGRVTSLTIVKPRTVAYKWSVYSTGTGSGILSDSQIMVFPADSAQAITTTGSIGVAAGSTIPATVVAAIASSSAVNMYKVATQYTAGSFTITIPYWASTGTGDAVVDFSFWKTTDPTSAGAYTQVASITKSISGAGSGSDFGLAAATFTNTITAGSHVFVAMRRTDTAATITVNPVDFMANVELRNF